jgi:tripartite ATP-independent transporter DctM subunit
MIGVYMFFVAIIFLMVGFPVAFAFGSAAVFTAFLDPEIGISVFNLLPFRIYGIMQNFNLIAVPLFIFMGLILEKSKIAEDMLVSVGKLFGSVRGGLAVSIVLVGAALGASTGIVGASVVMMSVISLPIMLRYNYSKSLSAGVIATSGTLGQIIPPSIVLIILGDVMSVDVGSLFRAALGPSLLLIALYIAYILIISYLNPDIAPAMPKSDESRSKIVLMALKSIIPPTLLIALVLGSIFMGVATPTESAAFGAIGSIVLTLLHGSFSLNTLKYASMQTLSMTSMIFMILIGATAFSLVFNEAGGADLVLSLFQDSIDSKWTFIAIAMGVIFLLGFVVDFLEITFIIIPILLPIIHHFGIDPLWFAILVAINLQASFLTPPFGFALFYLKGAAADQVSTKDIYKGVLPFIALQLLALLVVLMFPGIVGLF